MSQVVKKERCPECAKLGKDTKGDNLATYSDGHSYCFGCGYTLNSSASKLSNYVNNIPQPAPVAHKVFLPIDCVFEYPSEVMNWVGQYHLSHRTLLQHRVMWSPSKERLIFPVIGGENNFLAYAGRNFNLSDGKPKWVAYGDLKNTYHFIGEDRGTLVLCEDIVSAIKLSRVAQAMPLFGSHIGIDRWKRLSKIISRGVQCIIWLDPDMRLKSVGESCLGTSLGLNVRTIMSDKDPKEHTYEEINNILGLKELNKT